MIDVVYENPIWIDSNYTDEVFFAWQPTDGFGLLAFRDSKDERNPRLILCSLFEDPDGVFYKGQYPKQFSIKLSTLREILSVVEDKWIQNYPET